MMKLPYSSIRTAWDHFAKNLFRPGVSNLQRHEMRTAFYAGASCCFDIISFPPSENETEDEGVKRIAAIHQEFEEFAKTLKR